MVCKNGFSASVLLEGHIALRKRVYRKVLAECMDKDVDTRHIDMFEDVVSGACSVSKIGKNLYITMKNGVVSVGGAEKAFDEWQSCFESNRAVTPSGVFLLQHTEYTERM